MSIASLSIYAIAATLIMIGAVLSAAYGAFTETAGDPATQRTLLFLAATVLACGFALTVIA